MAKRSLADQLDQFVEAIMDDRKPGLPAADDRLTSLLQTAAELRDLPRADFKARLEAALLAAVPTPTLRPGFRSLTPYLQVRGAAALLDFISTAFGGQTQLRELRADGSIAHAEIRIGDSMLELADATAAFPPMPTALHLYVQDVDAAYAGALRAGATSIQGPEDQHYGERSASLRDPFGNHWYIATASGPAERQATAPHVPRDLPDLMPYLHPHGAPQVIDFLKQAFSADEMLRAEAADGQVMHAKLRIGNAVIELGEAHGPYQPMPSALHLYVADIDAVYQRALQAGAQTIYKPTDHAYGERSAGVRDPFDNVWYIATPIASAPSTTDTTPDKDRKN